MPDTLPARWRERAKYLREYGDPACARLWELAATELEASLDTQGEKTLTLTEASKVSGYTADHLGQLVRRGTIRNVGRDRAPRIRRSDLPLKGNSGPGRPSRALSAQADAEREQVQAIARSFTTRRHDRPIRHRT
ncbi:MAG: hypothetical protein ACRENK_09395 [Gemmatimonadaceae bacterium]